MLTWMRYGMASGITAVVDTNGYLHWKYLSDKLNKPGVANIAAILAFLNKKYNIKVGIPPGFDANGIHNGLEEDIVDDEDQYYQTW